MVVRDPDQVQHLTVFSSKAQTKAKRYRESAVARSVKGPRDLVNLSVQPATLIVYKKLLDQFQRWLTAVQQVGAQAPDGLDQQLAQYLTKIYTEGGTAQQARSIIAATGHHRADVGRNSRHGSPVARRVIQAFARTRPTHGRLPLPREVLLALVATLSRWGHRHVAVALLVGFSGYLRPGELMRITKQSVVAPVGK